MTATLTCKQDVLCLYFWRNIAESVHPYITTAAYRCMHGQIERYLINLPQQKCDSAWVEGTKAAQMNTKMHICIQVIQ